MGGKGLNKRVVGEYSKRPYCPEQAGGPICRLYYNKVRVSERGIDIVERHIARFQPRGVMEYKMVGRLRRILASLLTPEPVDLRFYTHELREYIRYAALGYRTGQPDNPDDAYELWNNAHTATLEDYGLREGRGVLFHLEAET